MAIATVGLLAGLFGAHTYSRLAPAHDTDKKHAFFERHQRINGVDNHPYSRRKYAASGLLEDGQFRPHGDAVSKCQLDAPVNLQGRRNTTPTEAKRQFIAAEREKQAKSLLTHRKHVSYH